MDDTDSVGEFGFGVLLSGVFLSGWLVCLWVGGFFLEKKVSGAFVRVWLLMQILKEHPNRPLYVMPLVWPGTQVHNCSHH